MFIQHITSFGEFGLFLLTQFSKSITFGVENLELAIKFGALGYELFVLGIGISVIGFHLG